MCAVSIRSVTTSTPAFSCHENFIEFFSHVFYCRKIQDSRFRSIWANSIFNEILATNLMRLIHLQPMPEGLDSVQEYAKLRGCENVRAGATFY